MTTTATPDNSIRTRAKRGIDKRRIVMALTPTERQELFDLATESGLSDSAGAAMIYRIGIEVYRRRRAID